LPISAAPSCKIASATASASALVTGLRHKFTKMLLGSEFSLAPFLRATIRPRDSQLLSPDRISVR
jgi:hypothetical protein